MCRRLTIALLLVLLLLPAAARAQSPSLMMLLAAPVGRYGPHFTYDMRALTESDVVAQGGSFSLLDERLTAGTPLWQNDRDELSFSGILEAQQVETTALLPDSGTPFPGKLWNVGFGPAYRHRFGNGWMLGGNAFVGSPSDAPFANARTLDIGGNVFLRIPTAGRSAWIVLLNYDSNREYLRYVPIPAAAYVIGRSRWVKGIVGVPVLALEFLHREPVSIHLSYFPIVRIKSWLEFHLAETVRLHAGFEWFNERFLRKERAQRSDRLFYYEKRFFAELELAPRKWARLRFSGGFAFDRLYFEGKHFWNADYNRINIERGPYAAMGLTFYFGGKRLDRIMRGEMEDE